MAEAVAHSTRYLTAEDLAAMAAYLKVVPAIQTDDDLLPVNLARLPSPMSRSIGYDLIQQQDYLAQTLANTKAKINTANSATDSPTDSSSPKSLYLAACASCHGVDGYAQPDARYASIVGLTSLRRAKPDALINVIAYGAKGALNTAPKMPGFAKELTHAQIADITNYVRVNIGGLQSSKVTADEVKKLMK